MELPKRKQIRLQGYDYSSNGAYFVTICVADKQHLLWNVGANCVRPNELPQLSDIGKIVDDRIIRNEQGYREVWQYIDENSLKIEDCFYHTQNK